MLGRTDTRTRESMYCQTIRRVRYISRDDRARIATTCSLRTPTEGQTDRLKDTYSVDTDLRHLHFPGISVSNIHSYNTSTVIMVVVVVFVVVVVIVVVVVVIVVVVVMVVVVVVMVVVVAAGRRWLWWWW